MRPDNIPVSIVITAYNIEGLVARAVKSALGQTHGDIEVVVVEDCSTDGTRAVLEGLLDGFEPADGRVLKLVRNEANMGAGISRRIGIGNATGEYVMTLDGDDHIREDFVERLLERGDGADIISGGITVVDIDGNERVFVYDEHVTEGPERIKGFFTERMVFINNKLIRRRLFDSAPYSGRRYIEDTPSMVPLLYQANRVKYVGDAGYFYVLREGSLTHAASEAKNCLFRGLCMKSFIEWAADKPREYRDMFRRRTVLEQGRKLLALPQDEVRKVVDEWPDEWNEFLGYLARQEELLFSLTIEP